METFEPGTTSAYSTHTFRVGEQGMKCLNCPRVMTMDEWEEKRRCFCQNTNAVRSVARSTPRTTLQTNRRPQLNWVQPSSDTSPVTSTTSTPSRLSLDIRGCATALALLLGLGWCTAQFGQSSKNQTQQTASTQNLQPKLTPQQVVTKYYQLAPSNREGAKALLSDAYKNWYKQNSADTNAKSYWDEINKVEVYNFANLSQSQSNHKIKIWLKYSRKDGGQPCESQEVEIILDQSKAQWLIDKTDNIEQKPDCGR